MVAKILSHYRLLGKIGEGGMGVVYRAEDTKLQRTVALKFLRPELTQDVQANARFIREARAAAAVDHPHICTVYEIGEAEGQTFIAMAFIEGQSLKQRIAEGPLPIDAAVRISTEVAEGLKAAHARGIVHRDIKPANIMLAASGRATIMDFGLAKLERAAELTRSATVLGTVAYMPPEQARGETVDLRSDVWSLGCVLYEMLTGRPPFEGEDWLAVLHAIGHDEPRPVVTRRQDVPAEVARVVHRCLQKDPRQRYGDMGDLLGDLASLVPGNHARRDASIAVLPFVDMSVGKDQEYFCDGIAEELINALAHIGNLRVVARTSAFAFKGQNIDVREIGRRLNVRAVLEGSIRKAGNRLRITAQLIDVEDGYHLWSEKFDREMEDIFAVQDEVSKAVVENLEVRLVPRERAVLEKRHTADPEAYNLYLKGLHFASRPSADNLSKALEYFRSATERDPRFAPAYVGMASTHAAFAVLSFSAPREAWAQAKAAVQQALALDGDLAEAHVQAGFRALYYDWDWEQADRSYRRALTLNPGLAWAHAWYAWLHTALGRFEDAISEIKRAQALDPLMPVFYAMSICIHRLAGRLDEAIAEFQRAVELDPSPGLAHFHVGCAYFHKGMLDEAERVLERVVSLGAFSGWGEAYLGLVHLARGCETEGRDILHAMIEKRRHAHVSPWCIGALAGALGDPDRAFEYLDAAYEERDPLMPFLNVFPEVEPLRLDPRFKVLVERMRLAF